VPGGGAELTGLSVEWGVKSVVRASQCLLGYDRDAELLLIAEVSRRLTSTVRSGEQESMESVMALLERQQHMAACRALNHPVEPVGA
jgi:hypothetical protein